MLTLEKKVKRKKERKPKERKRKKGRKKTKEAKSQTDNLNNCAKKHKERGAEITQSKQSEGNKDGAEVNETDNRKTIEKNNETKLWFLEKNKPLARLLKVK